MTTPPPTAPAAEPFAPTDPRGEMLRRLEALRGASSWDEVPAAASHTRVRGWDPVGTRDRERGTR